MKFAALRYTQNFIKNPELIQKLISKSTIQSGDTVYDLGAGDGALTIELIRAVGESGQVVAIEQDPKVFERLKQNVRGYKNCKVLQQSIQETQFIDTPYKVFSNIPFDG